MRHNDSADHGDNDQNTWDNTDCNAIHGDTLQVALACPCAVVWHLWSCELMRNGSR